MKFRSRGCASASSTDAITARSRSAPGWKIAIFARAGPESLFTTMAASAFAASRTFVFCDPLTVICTSGLCPTFESDPATWLTSTSERIWPGRSPLFRAARSAADCDVTIVLTADGLVFSDWIVWLSAPRGCPR